MEPSVYIRYAQILFLGILFSFGYTCFIWVYIDLGIPVSFEYILYYSFFHLGIHVSFGYNIIYLFHLGTYWYSSLFPLCARFNCAAVWGRDRLTRDPCSCCDHKFNTQNNKAEGGRAWEQGYHRQHNRMNMP